MLPSICWDDDRPCGPIDAKGMKEFFHLPSPSSTRTARFLVYAVGEKLELAIVIFWEVSFTSYPKYFRLCGQIFYEAPRNC